jgi:hypothetical protein
MIKVNKSDTLQQSNPQYDFKTFLPKLSGLPDIEAKIIYISYFPLLLAKYEVKKTTISDLLDIPVSQVVSVIEASCRKDTPQCLASIEVKSNFYSPVYQTYASMNNYIEKILGAIDESPTSINPNEYESKELFDMYISNYQRIKETVKDLPLFEKAQKERIEKFITKDVLGIEVSFDVITDTSEGFGKSIKFKE